MERVDTEGLDVQLRDTPPGISITFGVVALALFVGQVAAANVGIALLTLPLLAAAALVGIAVANSMSMARRVRLEPEGIAVRRNRQWVRHGWDEITAVGPVTERQAQWPMRSALHHGQASFTVGLQDGTRLRIRNNRQPPGAFEALRDELAPRA